MDSFDQKTLDNIEKFGCAVIHVAAEDDLPLFAYSVGIQKTANAPEVIVIGLKPELAHFVVNEYNRRVRAGERFVPGQWYEGFIGGFPIAIEQVGPEFYEEYFGMNLWLYQGPNFSVYQLVYPSTTGIWPFISLCWI